MNSGVVGCSLVPHPPIMLPEVAGSEADEVKETREGMKQLSIWIKQQSPDLMVIVTPHGPTVQGQIPIAVSGSGRGTLRDFNAPSVAVNRQIDCEFVHMVYESSCSTDIPVHLMDIAEPLQFDHGVVVPLFELQRHGVNLPLAYVGLPLVEREVLLKFGELLHNVAKRNEYRVLIVASGDLSHRLSQTAPSGYHPRGPEFDEVVVQSLKDNSLSTLTDLPESFVRQAGQCAYNPLLVAVGALCDRESTCTVHSYQGPFGVGYAVAHMEAKSEDRDGGEDQLTHAGQKDWQPVTLSRASLKHYLQHGNVIDVPTSLPDELHRESGAFVTLKKGDQLRGCMGTIEPTYPSVAEEIIHNTVTAGVRDPRFPPVQFQEIPELTFSVDVLTLPEKVSGPSELNPSKYGVVVQRGNRRGLLLPDLEGIDTVSQQVSVACQKAGLSPDDPDLQMLRFEVTRYRESKS